MTQQPAPKPSEDALADRCPRCGLERRYRKNKASCGPGYNATGCFFREETAEARVRELEDALREIVRLQGDRDYAHDEVDAMAETARRALLGPGENQGAA